MQTSEFKGIAFPEYISVVSLFSGMHFSCIPALPFDLPTQSDTYSKCYLNKFIAIITAYTACLEHAMYSGIVYVVLSIYI